MSHTIPKSVGDAVAALAQAGAGSVVFDSQSAYFVVPEAAAARMGLWKRLNEHGAAQVVPMPPSENVDAAMPDLATYCNLPLRTPFDKLPHSAQALSGVISPGEVSFLGSLGATNSRIGERMARLLALSDYLMYDDLTDLLAAYTAGLLAGKNTAEITAALA